VSGIQLVYLAQILTQEDLRETSVDPSQLKGAFWPQSALLPVLDNVECFAPYPQHRIPALLQTLEKSAFLHSQNDPDAQEPYVIHIDRVRAGARNRSPPRASGEVSRIAGNAYHVSDTYIQPSDRPERRWSGYERDQDYDDDYYEEDCYDLGGPEWFEDEAHNDSDSLRSDVEVRISCE
jgi:hypothetical protein